MQPFVIVKLDVKYNVDIKINCVAWAGSIKTQEKNVGSVTFSVRIS
jgi:hypothetical protein